MSFVNVQTTASSAVATNGTFTISAPTATLAGAIKNRGGHVMIVRSMAAVFNFPTDFSLSWSGATGTVTYLGTTTIPAGSLIQIQFELEGDDANFPYHGTNANQKDKTGAYRGSFGQVFRVDFGAPLVASTTAIVNLGAARTLALVTTYATPFVLDVPRALQCTSSSAGDTTNIITVTGLDEYGVAMSENFALNGTAVISGKKAFKTVISDTCTIAGMGGTLSVGFLNILGLPFYLPKQTGTGIGSILKESQDGATPTAGTAVGGDLTKATTTTGDVRGTIVPNVTPDGTKVYSVYMFVADTAWLGVPQA